MFALTPTCVRLGQLRRVNLKSTNSYCQDSNSKELLVNWQAKMDIKEKLGRFQRNQ